MKRVVAFLICMVLSISFLSVFAAGKTVNVESAGVTLEVPDGLPTFVRGQPINDSDIALSGMTKNDIEQLFASTDTVHLLVLKMSGTEIFMSFLIAEKNSMFSMMDMSNFSEQELLDIGNSMIEPFVSGFAAMGATVTDTQNTTYETAYAKYVKLTLFMDMGIPGVEELQIDVYITIKGDTMYGFLGMGFLEYGIFNGNNNIVAMVDSMQFTGAATSPPSSSTPPSSTAPVGTQENSAATTETENENTTSPIPFIIAGLVGAGILFGAIIFASKRKKNNTPPPPPSGGGYVPPVTEGQPPYGNTTSGTVTTPYPPAQGMAGQPQYPAQQPVQPYVQPAAQTPPPMQQPAQPGQFIQPQQPPVQQFVQPTQPPVQAQPAQAWGVPTDIFKDEKTEEAPPVAPPEAEEKKEE